MELCVELLYSEMINDSEIEKIAKQGVTAISVPYDFIESAPVEIIKERAAVLAANGIKALTAHPRFGSYNSANSLANQYVTQRNLYIEQLKNGMERMSILGVKTAPLHTNGACLAVAPNWALELCAESVHAVAPAAQEAGIILAIENTFFPVPQRWDGGYGTDARPPQEPETVYDDMSKICKLIDMLASPYVKGCFDAGHAHYLGDLADDHKTMGDRIYLYHLQDNSRDRDTHLPPGYGTLDWETMGELMTRVSNEYVAYIEASPWMRGTYGSMIRETNALLSGGRKGEYRRCMKCGHLILTDEDGLFCCCIKNE
ncbi:MAG: sugar phosphate isomerase/epimerase [Oscillospiraceae bacterium]|nr:sugar phosphate isomerase/epimerase [Oscillospiraceae bacterium]